MNLGTDLAARLTAYADACRRPVGAVVADAVEEYLGAHPNHEQIRAAGLQAMREYEAEFGPFTEAELAEADARLDRLFGTVDDEHGGSRTEGVPDGRDV